MMTETPPMVDLGLDRVNTTNGDSHEQTLYLSGRPSLRRFMRYIRNQAIHPPNASTLADEWHAAHDHIARLQDIEAGLVDNPPIVPLTQFGKKYESLLIEFLKDPVVNGSFNTVPTDVALVELDRMVVHQKHIDLTHVRALKKKLGPAPSDETIFRTCLPFDHPQPPVKWTRTQSDTFVFVSPSNDLRFLGALSLEPHHITDYSTPGTTVGIAGLAVGFGSNFLNAICVEGRLILKNGSHRAYALRDLGITHVPCVVQYVSTRDALDSVAADEVTDNPDLYLKQARPPMLKDYFDPKLHKVIEVERRIRQVTVTFEVKESYIPAI
jgi:hypothetical protein